MQKKHTMLFSKNLKYNSIQNTYKIPENSITLLPKWRRIPFFIGILMTSHYFENPKYQVESSISIY